jgi:hypothetical protein
MEANLECLQNLDRDLRKQEYDLRTIPYVLQLNHRHLPDVLPVDEMKKKLVIKDEPVLQAIATAGIGVCDTLKAIVKLILIDLTKADGERAPVLAWHIARRFARKRGRYRRSRYFRRFLRASR